MLLSINWRGSPINGQRKMRKSLASVNHEQCEHALAVVRTNGMNIGSTSSKLRVAGDLLIVNEALGVRLDEAGACHCCVCAAARARRRATDRPAACSEGHRRVRPAETAGDHEHRVGQ